MKVLCCGSFDPVTKGHEELVLRAAALFETVYVVVALNPEKHYLFSPEERLYLCRKTFELRQNVQVLLHDGLVAELAVQLGAGALVKGVRNGVDLEYETQLFEINRILAPGLDTVFLPASSQTSFISSSCVREFLRFGRDLSAVAPDRIVDEIKNIYSERK